MATTTPNLRTYSLREAVEATGIPERTLRSLVQTRKIPYIKIGKYLRFHPADLQVWLAESTKPALASRGRQ